MAFPGGYSVNDWILDLLSELSKAINEDSAPLVPPKVQPKYLSSREKQIDEIRMAYHLRAK